MAAPPIDRFTALPPELLSSIIELLPPREIDGFRIVCRALRTYIDRSEDALARLTIAHHQQRICNRDALLLDLKGLDLIDILHHYVSYYGEVGVRSPLVGTHILANLLNSTLERKFAGLTMRGQVELGKHLLRFWHWFIICHDWMHSRALPPDDYDRAYDRIQRAWTALEGKAALLGDPVSDPDYLRSKVQDSTLLSGPHFADARGLPRYQITPRGGLKCCSDPNYISRCHKLLEDCLGLPALGGGLGYCVKTEEMLRMLRRACTTAEPDWSLLFRSRLRQAALLEEVFVF